MGKSDSLSHASYLEKVALFEQWAPEPLKAFRRLAEKCLSDGALPVREKELIAVGSAHVLRCPYCIDHHVNLALQAGAEKSEIAESVWVGIAMGASACYAHAQIAATIMDESAHEGDYYASDRSKSPNLLSSLTPKAHQAYTELHQVVFKAGALSSSFKELVAIACAHNSKCPFCIDTHVHAALEAGRSKIEVAEAVWVGIEMGAGACFGHAGLAAKILEEAP